MLTFSWRLRATRRLAQATLLTALRGSLRGAFCGALLVAMSGPASVAAASLEGQQFDETAVLAERTLRLNGLGLRGVAWVKAFVAGLYLPAPTRDAAQVLTMPGPKRLRLKIMLEAPSHELTKSLTSRIARHEPDNVKAQLGARLDTLASHIDSIGNLRVGDTIDLATATYKNTIGAANLATVWTDPEFDPAVRAFYYLRVLEIPTPRWPVYDAIRFKLKLTPDVQVKQQERAYTSAIWYNPAKS